ncbi:MAG: sugar phosphate nucleotidyltransferase, partial [Conexivisphaerales archaeon]
MENAEAVVLCGGLGSRLRPLTYYFQKTMLPIGREQRPILEYILRSLTYNGIRKAVLLANYKFEQIKNYFGNGSKFGLRVFYGMDPPTLSGSGGALLNAYNNGLINRDNTALVYYGDILTTMNLRE